MNIHEFQAKALLKKHGVPVPGGDVADSAERAGEIARELGGTVVVSGMLHSRHAKWLCLECCRHVAGVIKLVDRIKVQSSSRKTAIN